MIPIANPVLGEREIERVSAVIESGMLADGGEVRAFEQEFADYCGVEHGVATSNGTTALHAALEALEIGDGDRVLTTPFSFVATANAIRHAGAKPVFADIDPATYNLDPTVAREAATKADVDAILVVHLYGLPAEMGGLTDLADDLGVPLVEDCAQAHGATYRGDHVGSFGDAACFSFYPTKNMTTGEGGMILTDRPEVADRAERYVDHGRTDDGTHATVGHNFRMTNLAAAIGRAQLERLPVFLERRRENAARLTDGLSGTSLSLPTEPGYTRHTYHQYTVRVPDRRALRDHLAAHDIGSGVYYSDCIHDEPAYNDVTHDAPEAEQAAAEGLSLPVHPNISADDIDHITEVITDYAA
ncbi:DegT/DnrJ/EryC1/StrS family aminotransferase [Natronorubrum thiooxidans]|uniref:dTDP-4-amino-4,6-dideoxygalactose transaminase n=1 Tax=Natronorubrum thiooxidans TaxID=308853 RepID=A0A1N7FRL4_9EURY|nr:DegT/DnrJ/EryC1/StrS family aminotransferase [Natronorubrum thiooxidans]SIS02983.1 dTDP-4-amino-4,6-dideoxygalactose transaminase [Natronorubrum thiooxidans]